MDFYGLTFYLKRGIINDIKCKLALLYIVERKM